MKTLNSNTGLTTHSSGEHFISLVPSPHYLLAAAATRARSPVPLRVVLIDLHLLVSLYSLLLGVTQPSALEYQRKSKWSPSFLPWGRQLLSPVGRIVIVFTLHSNSSKSLGEHLTLGPCTCESSNHYQRPAHLT